MSRTEHYDRIKSFMKLAKQETPDFPIMPSLATRKLRASLIIEECLETVKALGFDVIVAIPADLVEECYDKMDEVGAAVDFSLEMIELESNGKENLIEIADGVADISVVSVGTLVACGIEDKELLETVDQNNLDKFGPGHSFRADGKLIKPANHTKPDIGKIINGQSEEKSN